MKMEQNAKFLVGHPNLQVCKFIRLPRTPEETHGTNFSTTAQSAQSAHHPRQCHTRHHAAAGGCRSTRIPRWLDVGRQPAARGGSGSSGDLPDRRQGLHHAQRHRGDENSMPRPSKGPRLALFKAKGRTTVWNIRDGQRTIGTGCLEGDRATAEKKLAEYITSKHDPKASRSGGDPNAIKIADALSVYMVEKIAHSARPKAGIAMVENLGDFFGERTIGELNGQLQRDFAKQRGSQSAARRELETAGSGDQLPCQGHGRRRADAIPSNLARCPGTTPTVADPQ